MRFINMSAIYNGKLGVQTKSAKSSSNCFASFLPVERQAALKNLTSRQKKRQAVGIKFYMVVQTAIGKCINPGMQTGRVLFVVILALMTRIKHGR